MSKKILIAAGGSGGHLYPAQSFAEKLLERNSDTKILFAGGGLEKNTFLNSHLFNIICIQSATFTLRRPWQIPSGLLQIALGVNQAHKCIHTFQPDAVVGFGSYHSLPVLLAAKVAGIPIVLHAADSIPGKVLRFMSRSAKATGVQFPVASRYLKGRSVEVGLPLRNGFVKGAVGKMQAKEYFRLDPDQPVLLAFGGSQGAQNLNRLLIETLDMLPKNWQLLHLTGNSVFAEKSRIQIQSCGRQGHTAAYEERMDLAWQAADFALTRAGAGTLAEMLEFEVPTLLVPYPYAADQHQEMNARFFCEEAGVALFSKEQDLTSEFLTAQLNHLAKQGSVLREAMGQYKKGRKKKDFIDLVFEVIQER